MVKRGKAAEMFQRGNDHVNGGSEDTGVKAVTLPELPI